VAHFGQMMLIVFPLNVVFVRKSQRTNAEHVLRRNSRRGSLAICGARCK
jgi:hypothetical protein